jgi:TDG/mug DNA glycosylase family protein
LPELLAPGLDVIFVGAAPSLYAAERGHYYAGPRNRFWLLLYQAGFTPRQLREEEDSRVLDFGIGLTAIFPSIASSDNSKLPAATERDREDLRSRLLPPAPRVVAYNGKDVHQMCTGKDSARWGLQREMLGRSRQFVLPSSSGRADRWGPERLHFYRELKALIDTLKRSPSS